MGKKDGEDCVGGMGCAGWEIDERRRMLKRECFVDKVEAICLCVGKYFTTEKMIDTE